jgi:pantetheine-phosphate adenylyltransferase
MIQKILAIYPGSFNPLHIGHLNIIEKAQAIFGKENVIVAIGENPSKVQDITNSKLLKFEEIDARIEEYNCFLHEYIRMKELEGFNVVLIRGLRNGDDLSYEMNQLSFIHDFKPDVKTIFIACDKEFEHISSSAIRQLEKFREGSSSSYIPKKK